MFNSVFNLLFPRKCPFCGKILSEKAPVCSNCMMQLPFTGNKVCRVCGRPLEEFSHEVCPICRNEKTYFEHSFVPLRYKGSARDGAIALKGGHPYFSKGIAYLLADKILTSRHFTKFDFITYVPQSPRSRRIRGYNQSELIAKELSKLLNVECVATLIRTNDGEQQHTLNAARRRENVKKCYFPKEMKGSGTILLVDDIYTTGATANYCSKLLLGMGYEKVYCAISMIKCDE